MAAFSTCRSFSRQLLSKISRKEAMPSSNNYEQRYIFSLSIVVSRKSELLRPTYGKTRTSVYPTADLRNYSTVEQKCWKCGRKVDEMREQFICKCGVLQAPVDGRTYFDVLNQEVSFKIDIEKLTTNFRQLQSFLHPDKHGLKSQEEQDFAQQQSTVVNRAYQTLLKPLSRAQYILQLNGYSISDHETVNSTFLMQMMEVNEKLSETTSMAEIEQIEQENDAQMRDVLLKLETEFAKRNFDTAKELVVKLTYLVNIQEKVKEEKQKYH